MPLYENAWLYDQEFRDRVHEIPFYRRHAIASGGPVLELACGTGRLSVPIAEAGVEVVGVDVSAPMLERARRRSLEARVDIAWHEQDVRTLDLRRRFRFAFMAANALQHLHGIDSILGFFERARLHLDRGGLLGFDVYHPDLEKLSRRLGAARPHKEFTLDDGRRIHVDVDSEYASDTQILHFVLTYRDDEELLLVKDVRMRCFFPEELLALCRMGGFDVVERFGDFDESPFRTNSPNQILLCRARR